jgi:hypothetical protein
MDVVTVEMARQVLGLWDVKRARTDSVAKDNNFGSGPCGVG